jgi:hypothetical protein
MRYVRKYIDSLIKIQQESIIRYENMTAHSPAMEAYIENQVRNKQEQIEMLRSIVKLMDDIEP